MICGKPLGIALCLLIVTFIVPTSSGQEESLRARFQREYPPALEALEAFYGRAHGTASVKEELMIGSAQRKSRSFEIEFWVDGRRRRLDRTWGAESDGKKKGHLVADISGASRTFSVGRPPGTDIYRINSIDKNQIYVDDNINIYVAKFVRAPFALDEVRVADLMKSPGYALKTVEAIRGGPEPLVGVEFVVRPSDGKSPYPDGPALTKGIANISARMILSPGRMWAIEEYEVKIIAKNDKTPLVRSGTVEYLGTEEGIPLVGRVVANWARKNKHRYEFNVKEIRNEEIAADVFSLASFGYGDLDRATLSNQPDNSASAFFFAISGAIIILMIAIGIWRKRTEMKSEAPG